MNEEEQTLEKCTGEQKGKKAEGAKEVKVCVTALLSWSL
jgi:hypothetical protein